MRRKAPIATAPGPVTINPNAVYTRAQATALLGLRPRTLRREVALGRLRESQRGGKRLILGEWLLEWLRGGEVPRPDHNGKEAPA